MPQALINNTSLYYEEHGRGSPLVMIQGFAGSQSAWYFQIRAFRKCFRVITFDARGLGKSNLSKVPYTVPVMADDVIGLMNYLKIEKAHILGLSLGGIVAQTIAIDHPEKVMKLILASTLPGIGMQYISDQARAAGIDFNNLDVFRVMEYFISIAFNRPVYRFICGLIARLPMVKQYRGYLGQMQALGDYGVIDRLHFIQAPTLVITGSGDRLIPPYWSEVIASKIRYSRLVMVKGGSHAFFLEMRGRFNREVLQFLQSP